MTKKEKQKFDLMQEELDIVATGVMNRRKEYAGIEVEIQNMVQETMYMIEKGSKDRCNIRRTAITILNHLLVCKFGDDIYISCSINKLIKYFHKDIEKENRQAIADSYVKNNMDKIRGMLQKERDKYKKKGDE